MMKKESKININNCEYELTRQGMSNIQL